MLCSLLTGEEATDFPFDVQLPFIKNRMKMAEKKWSNVKQLLHERENQLELSLGTTVVFLQTVAELLTWSAEKLQLEAVSATPPASVESLRGFVKIVEVMCACVCVGRGEGEMRQVCTNTWIGCRGVYREEEEEARTDRHGRGSVGRDRKTYRPHGGYTYTHTHAHTHTHTHTHTIVNSRRTNKPTAPHQTWSGADCRLSKGSALWCHRRERRAAASRGEPTMAETGGDARQQGDR